MEPCGSSCVEMTARMCNDGFTVAANTIPPCRRSVAAGFCQSAARHGDEVQLYFLPRPSVAAQETPDACRVAKFPTSLHVPADDSTDGTGTPSSFGLSLDFTSIRSTDNS
jgi:hypothetical protein